MLCRIHMAFYSIKHMTISIECILKWYVYFIVDHTCVLSKKFIERSSFEMSKRCTTVAVIKCVSFQRMLNISQVDVSNTVLEISMKFFHVCIILVMKHYHIIRHLETAREINNRNDWLKMNLRLEPLYDLYGTFWIVCLLRILDFSNDSFVVKFNKLWNLIVMTSHSWVFLCIVRICSEGRVLSSMYIYILLASIHMECMSYMIHIHNTKKIVL